MIPSPTTIILLTALHLHGPHSLAAMPVYAKLDGVALVSAFAEALRFGLVSWTAGTAIRLTDSGVSEVEREPSEWPALGAM